MSGALAPGKLPARLLAELLASGPKPPPELLVPPRPGEDACVIDVPGGALVVAADPITLTGRGVGALAVVVNANDVAVMGARPRWFLATLLLPIGTTESLVRAIFAEMHEALDRLDVALVGGHSEITHAVRQPVISGQMLGLREDGGYVRTGGVRPGDLIVQVGPAPVEGAAVLAAECGDALRDVPAELLARAKRALEDPGISVVDAALRCCELGVTAMHDPTEGGLSAGLHELAETSGVALRDLARERVLWFEPGLALCERVGADPWGTLASGCLLASFPPSLAATALRGLAASGLCARQIARADVGAGVWLQSGEPLQRHERDELSRILSTGTPERA